MNALKIQYRSWYLYDLDGKVLGRVSTEIASILQGKHHVSYDRSRDTGDYVVVINASKFKLTGSKFEQKYYYKHSGYIGNLKKQSIKDKMKTTPSDIIINSVSGMLPKNKLRDRMLKRLKVYLDSDHPHKNIKFTKEIK